MIEPPFPLVKFLKLVITHVSLPTGLNYSSLKKSPCNSLNRKKKKKKAKEQKVGQLPRNNEEKEKVRNDEEKEKEFTACGLLYTISAAC